MQAAFLDEADPAAISQVVRGVLDRRGALISEHVSHRIRFASMESGSAWSWNRAGYVGIYQHYGEKSCEVRLDLRAAWPNRVLWMVAAANVLIWILTFVLNPPGTTWFVLAFLTGMALLIAGLVSLNTWRSVRAQEKDLMAEFEREFEQQNVSPTLLTAEARAIAAAEAQLEGEIARSAARAARKSQPKPVQLKVEKPAKILGASKLKLPFGKKKSDDEASAEPASDEDADAKRARLLALKAEIERKKGEQ